MTREAQLLDELERTREECERRVSELVKSRQSDFDRLAAELSGTASEREALRVKEEREARVELLRRQMVRRAMNRELSSGWSAWLLFAEARGNAYATLRHVSNKLRTPELAGAFRFWVEDIAEARRQVGCLSCHALTFPCTVFPSPSSPLPSPYLT